MTNVMRTIVVKDGRFDIPETYQGAKILRITFQWVKEFRRYCKDGTTSVNTYFRHKGTDKPYLPDGFIEINGEMFIVENLKEEKA